MSPQGRLSPLCISCSAFSPHLCQYHFFHSLICSLLLTLRLLSAHLTTNYTQAFFLPTLLHLPSHPSPSFPFAIAVCCFCLYTCAFRSNFPPHSFTFFQLRSLPSLYHFLSLHSWCCSYLPHQSPISPSAGSPAVDPQIILQLAVS